MTSTFQFHKGAIGVGAATFTGGVISKFQFHKGAIGVFCAKAI